jgi:hypothetical protein
LHTEDRKDLSWLPESAFTFKNEEKQEEKQTTLVEEPDPKIGLDGNRSKEAQDFIQKRKAALNIKNQSSSGS